MDKSKKSFLSRFLPVTRRRFGRIGASTYTTILLTR